MFATKTPSTAPTDAGEKQDHLRALALLTLTKGVGRFGPTPSSHRPTAASTEDGATEERERAETGQPDEWDSYESELTARSKRFGRPECVFVIDTTNLGQDGRPTVDWGIPITIPWPRVQDLFRNAAIRPVIVRDGAVIDTNGELNLGRTTRLANRAQRRALRAI